MLTTLRNSLRRALGARADELTIRRYRVLSGRRSRSEAVDQATLRGFRKLAAAEPPSRRAEKTVTSAFSALAEADLSGERPSRRVRRAVVEQFHRLYYHSAKQTWQDTSYLGVPVWKNPCDLWLYQELIHDLRPDVLIEAGTKFGGSAYYFARLFDLLGHGRVVTIDVERQPDLPEHPRITYLSGSSADPAIAEQVDGIVGDGRTLVVLDSSHRRDHVLAELRLWSSRVPVGSYIVVEDTHADGHPVTTRFGPGPWDAVKQFCAEDDRFVVDESMHKFFFTFNPSGYLKRVR